MKAEKEMRKEMNEYGYRLRKSGEKYKVWEPHEPVARRYFFNNIQELRDWWQWHGP